MKKLFGLAIVSSMLAIVACSTDDESSAVGPATGCLAGTEPLYDAATGAFLGCNPVAASSSDMALAASSSSAALVAASSSSDAGLTPIAASSSSDALVVASSSSVAAPVSSSVAAAASSSSAKVTPASSAAKETPAASSDVLGLWDAAEGSSQVPTSDAKGGYWYFYTDKDSKGSSTITWDAEIGSEYSKTDLAPLVKELGALSGSFTLVQGDNENDPFVGIAFDMTDGGKKTVDATSAKGVCMTYSASSDVMIQLGLTESGDQGVGYNNPTYIAPASSNEKTIQAKWADFEQQWTGEVDMTGDEAAKKLGGIKLQFKDADGTTGTFKIVKLGAYGLCS